MMKMVVRRYFNPSSGFLPALGGMKMTFGSSIQNRSMGTNKIEGEEHHQILCVGVWAGSGYGATYQKLRWYGITPPVSARRSKLQKKSCAGNGSRIALIKFSSTNTTLDPSLLCEFNIKNLPRYFSCVALNSKIHIIADKDINQYQGHLPDDVVLDIDTSRQKIAVGYGQPMISGKDGSAPVVFDGKMYVFARRAYDEQPLSCEVFDPNTRKWDALPAPAIKAQRFYPVLYEKKKKILLFHNGAGACAFDVSTSSWEYDGLDMPSKVIEFMFGIVHSGERHVIIGDLLYMFDEDEFKLSAYDLNTKEHFQVHGLEGETRIMICEENRDARPFPIFLLQLGKKNICLVTAYGPAGGGLPVVCLEFHVQKRDGGLHAVILGRDIYFVEQAFGLIDCVTLKRAGLGTSAIPCSFHPDHEDQQTGVGARAQQ